MNRFFPYVLGTDESIPRRNKLAAGNEIPIEQQLADSFNANNAVLAYCIGIANSQLPVIIPNPKWYDNFKADFSNAVKNANLWYSSIAPNLSSIPASIKGYGYIFSMKMVEMNQALKILQNNPGDINARNSLKADLTDLLFATRNQRESVINFRDNQLILFKNLLEIDANKMKKTIEDAKNEENINKQAVAKFSTDITNLKKKIETWNIVLIAGVVIFVVSIFVCAIGIAIPLVGLVVVGVIGMTAGFVTMALADSEIKKLQQQLEVDNAQLDTLSKQFAALEVLVQNVSDLTEKAKQASSQIDLIISTWYQLETNITAVINDLADSEVKLSSDDFESLQKDLNNANDDWNTLSKFCEIISNIKYAKANPEYGVIQIQKTA